VQQHSPVLRWLLVKAVKRIAHDGVTDRLQMHAQLVA
jgi:hypothetical protein